MRFKKGEREREKRETYKNPSTFYQLINDQKISPEAEGRKREREEVSGKVMGGRERRKEGGGRRRRSEGERGKERKEEGEGGREKEEGREEPGPGREKQMHQSGNEFE